MPAALVDIHPARLVGARRGKLGEPLAPGVGEHQSYCLGGRVRIGQQPRHDQLLDRLGGMVPAAVQVRVADSGQLAVARPPQQQPLNLRPDTVADHRAAPVPSTWPFTSAASRTHAGQ